MTLARDAKHQAALFYHLIDGIGQFLAPPLVYFEAASVFALAAASALDFCLSNSSSISTNVLPGVSILPANAG